MGGGAAMRAAAKAAGMGVFNNTIRSSGVTATSMSLRRPPSTTGAAATVKINDDDDNIQRPCWEVDDWELAGGVDDSECGHPALVLDRIEPVKPRLVFGPVPSLEEAKLATNDLKEALDKIYLSSPKAAGSVDSVSSFSETKSCIIHESAVPKNAVQAFKMLKENSAAQTVVASIACDPNVWTAVMQNPALVDFLEQERKFSGPEVQECPEDSVSSDEQPTKLDGLAALFEDVKLTVLDMVNSMSNFVQSLFAEPTPEKKSESSDGTAKTLFAGGSFMALAMMVIMVVVMKRG